MQPGSFPAAMAAVDDAVDVARRIRAELGRLESFATAAGSEVMVSAGLDFLEPWRQGLGCLAEDAERLRSQLGLAAQAYVEVESDVAGATGG